jgi:hypothetical protein
VADSDPAGQSIALILQHCDDDIEILRLFDCNNGAAMALYCQIMARTNPGSRSSSTRTTQFPQARQGESAVWNGDDGGGS